MLRDVDRVRTRAPSSERRRCGSIYSYRVSVGEWVCFTLQTSPPSLHSRFVLHRLSGGAAHRNTCSLLIAPMHCH